MSTVDNIRNLWYDVACFMAQYSKEGLKYIEQKILLNFGDYLYVKKTAYREHLRDRAVRRDLPIS